VSRVLAERARFLFNFDQFSRYHPCYVFLSSYLNIENETLNTSFIKRETMHTTSLKRISTVTILATLFFIITLAAQEKNQTKDSGIVTFKAQTNLVLVPVIVTDKQGHHVNGLTIADFELKEDGAIQKIANVDEVTADPTLVKLPTLPPGAFTNQVITQTPKKLEIFALDMVNNPFSDQYEMKRGLLDYLAKGVTTDTLFALVAFRSNGVQIIHDFTSDSAVLSAAIKKVQSSLSSRDIPALEVRGDEDAEAAQLKAIINGGPAAARAMYDSSRASQNGMITLECFQQIAQIFGSISGRKSLIWATVGFQISSGGLKGEAVGGTTTEEWERTVRMLQDANIAIYPVDVSGLVPDPKNYEAVSLSNAADIKSGSVDVGSRSAAMEAVGTGRFLDPAQSRQQNMKRVADVTGGQAFYNLNNSDTLYGLASGDSGQYYMLTYRLTDTSKTGWHKLNIRVLHDGVQVRSRTGFFINHPADDAAKIHDFDLKQALASSLNFTSLTINGQWQQVEPAGDQRKVQFVLQIPANSMEIDTEHENQVGIDFIVLAFDAKGKEAARITQRVERKLPQEAVSQIQTHGLNYGNVLTLAPGQYSVRIVVRDNLRSATGSITVPLKVD